MKLLLLVIFFSGSQGAAGSNISGLLKPKHAQDNTGVQMNDSGILGQARINPPADLGSCYTDEDLYPEVEGIVGESYSLACPLTSDLPLLPNITWKKNCTSELGTFNRLVFESLTTADTGYYTCTWSLMNGTHVYNMSGTRKLMVEEADVELDPKIIQPQDNAEIKVDLGEEVTVLCIAMFHSKPEFSNLVWMKGNSFVNEDPSIFVNNSGEQQKAEKYQILSMLVFRRVSPKHLNTKYTCKLESPYLERNNVSFTLSQRGVAPSPFLWLGLLAMFTVIASVAAVIYVELKIDIVLFFREVRGASSALSDGKQYDAYIMYYKAASEEALTEEEQRLIPHILETEFGYRLCLYERDILPGRAVPEAVLEHIEQSRRLVLLPGTAEAEQESWATGGVGAGDGDEQGLLSGLHAALVDRQTRLVLVERAPRGKSCSLPKPLQMLVRSGGSVAWRGDRSAPLSSRFWKKLRYYMPAGKSHKHRAEMTAL